MKKSLIIVATLFFLLITGLVSKGQSIKDSCIVKMKIFTYEPIDSLANWIKKKAVSNFLKRINDCGMASKYSFVHEDRSFEMIAPSYLTKRSYHFGENRFSFQFTDTSVMYATLRSITVYYDFIGAERKFFQDRVARGIEKVEWREIEGRKVQLYKSTEGLYCGKLDLDDITFIMFSTGDKNYTEELLRSILSFMWK